MNVVGCFEKGPRLALGRMRIAMLGNEIRPGIGRASAEGNPTQAVLDEQVRSGGLARLGDNRLADRIGQRLGLFARTSRRVDETHAI